MSINPRRSSRLKEGKFVPANNNNSRLPGVTESPSILMEERGSESDMDATIVEVADKPQDLSTLKEMQKQIQELRSQLEAATFFQGMLSRQQQEHVPITVTTTSPITVSSTVNRSSTAVLSQGTGIVTAATATAMCTGPFQHASSSLPSTFPPSQTSIPTPIDVTQRLSTFLPPLNTLPPYSQSMHIIPPQLYTSPSYSASQPTLNSGRKLHDLPEFTGRPEEWPMFSTAFQESTQMFNYTKVENIFRLQKCIKGEAKEVVEALLIHPNNVERVMAALEFRFGRPECLLRSQLTKVRNIPNIPEGKLELLIPFSTRVQNLSTFLESSGLHQHLANPTLIDELIAKLPMSKRLEWAQRSVCIVPYPTLKHFDEWLSLIARLVCLVTTNSLDQPARLESRKPRNVLHATEQPKPAAAANNDSCRYCKGDSHQVASCSAYTCLDVQKKWEFVKNRRLCFCCLKYGHSARSCRSRKSCGVSGCPRIHHPSLHEPKELKIITTHPDETHQEPKKTLHSCDANANSKILFRVLPVRLYNDSIMVKTYALLDEGSSITIMSADLAKQLKLRGHKKPLNLQWLGKETLTEQSLAVDLQISADKDQTERFTLCSVQTVTALDLPTQTLTDADLQQLYKQRIMPPLCEYKNAKPQLLIGLDNCHLGAPLRTIQPADTEPVIAETKLGWVIYGRTSTEVLDNYNDAPVFHINEITPENDIRLHTMVEEYFTLENFGVKKPTKQLLTTADKRALRILSDTTINLGNRYQTGLLWKEDSVNVPPSYEMAKRRLLSLENKLRKEPDFAATYKDIITSYLKKGYARKLTEPEVRQSTPRTWYLPHFGVRNPHKPDKIRLVFDAAAKVSNVSLNSFLLKGPVDLQPLLAILFNFRMRPIAVMGDIKEMFHQVRIKPEDQCSQRFLWRESDDLPIDIYVMQSMTFGASCSPCSANFIKNLNALRFQNDHPRAVKSIVEHHYVDDYVDSFDSIAEAVDVTKAVITIHRTGGFELCNLSSNSYEVLREISKPHDAEHQNNVVDMNMDAAVEKVLGMCWKPSEDVFTYSLNFPRVSKDVLVNDRCPTKRELLGIAMSMFDPFGMVANYVVHIKLMLGSVWKREVGWDDPIPAEIFERWKRWKAELPNLSQYRIPRCHDLSLSSANNLVLHTFVDASGEAFAAVTYLRAEFSDRISVSFVCGKTRCAPKQLMSIPRLELSAAVLGVRLCDTVIKHHDLAPKSPVFWSDSKTVLNWLRSDPRQHKQFVAFRIAEVLESTKVGQWRWVPTKLNPADQATRAKNLPKQQISNCWLSGPQFLQMPEDHWPAWPDDIHTHVCPEEQRSKALLHTNPVSTSFIDISRFSRYRKLQRTVAWILRFIRACQRKPKEKGELSISELNEADILLCRQAQKDAYGAEIARLEENQSVEKSSAIFKLTPYLSDDGLLRVYGRIDAATTIPLAARRPIILPKIHPLSMLIVDHYHCLMRHQNDDTVANEVRLKYWIPSLRSAVKRAKHQCQYCRFLSVQPLPPLMGQLPEDRLTPFIRPFTYTGLDYFGPVSVTVRRQKEKRWIALFTCLTMRAVHLEVAADLSTDACVVCIRNFVNRRGVPVRIRSDNGTNFIGAKKELLTVGVFDNEVLKAELGSKGIDWVFNCPSTPHAGGPWERLVRSVKRALSYTLREIAPRPETLLSSLLEAENIVNSRTCLCRLTMKNP